MDPATLAVAVVTILAPYVADAGKELVKATGEVGLAKAKDLLLWLRAKLVADPVASKDLERFEKNPEAFAEGLRETVASKAAEGPAFSAEISGRVKDLGPLIQVIQQYEKARNMVGIEAERVRSGQLNVTQSGKDADGVTGVAIKTID